MIRYVRVPKLVEVSAPRLLRLRPRGAVDTGGRYPNLKQHGRLAFFSILVIVGCSKPPPVIVLDGWWDVDYAKNVCESANKWHKEDAALISQVGCDRVTSCREMLPIVEACTPDPVQDVRRFENELATQFAGSVECSAVSFVYYEGPGKSGRVANDAAIKPNYSLSLDYQPGASRQRWKMVSPNKAPTQGEGNAEEIAKKVCFIAREMGAKIAN